MNEGRLKCIISGLSRYELTFLEKRFIEAANIVWRKGWVDGRAEPC
jgi:hypothetical protein